MAETSGILLTEYHQPPLPDGDYNIEVTQEILADTKIDKDNQFTASLSFSVFGPRFTLDPQEIQAVFPPAGSLGDHANVFPHIILNRSTLPWERRAILGSNEVMPWLALLLFTEDEVKNQQVITQSIKLSKLKENTDKFPTYIEKKDSPPTDRPYWKEESGDHDDDALTVIDVDLTLLQQIIPTTAELKLLAHVRQTQDSSGKSEGDGVAVIICNRLPEAGKLSTMHLVSVEGRYQGKTFKTQAGTKIQLVSLTSWRFACIKDQPSFSGLLKNLDTKTLRLSLLESSIQDDNTAANRYLERGCVTLSHAMRQGNKTVSWYHGPLVPGKNTTPTESEFALPARSADDLVLYNSIYGMFDVSYAAAWELGRLLALQSKSFSISLYNWKRTHAHKIKDAQQQIEHLPLDGPAASLELPEAVSSWFEHLALLEGVPFNYLVPDERLLPPESIRFFQLDPMWMECLLDGAFSIGRVLATDRDRDASLRGKDVANVASHTHNQISGFLLRSDVVAGWPGLLVDGYDEATQHKLPLLRMAKLSKNILICLFDGIVKEIDLHLKSEALHFGLEPSNSNSTQKYSFSKTMGSETKPAYLRGEQTDKEYDPKNRVIAINKLANTLKSANSANFASKMIEGVEGVRFIQG